MKHYLLSLILFAVPLFGEGLPEAPVPVNSSPAAHPVAEVAVQPASNKVLNRNERDEHRFFSRSNNIRFAALAGLVAVDGATTQIALTNGSGLREVDPLARPFVSHGAAGQTAASAVGLGFSLGTCYLLHRTGHYRLERLMLDASLAVEAETVASNSWYLVH
jgi:hypothetical protein